MKRNPGSYAQIVLMQVTHKVRGTTSMRTLTYTWVDGAFTPADTRDGQLIDNAELISVTVVPGSSLAVLRASNAVDSIDYGRQLYDRGGGLVVIVTQVMQKLVPVGMHYCQIETVGAWEAVLSALRVAIPDVDKMRRSLIGDRLTGADEMIARVWGASQNKDRLYCAFHILLNLNDANLIKGAGKVKDESLFWALAGSKNEMEYAEHTAAFKTAYPVHYEYLKQIPAEKFVLCKAAAAGVWTAGVRASHAEPEFARGKKNECRTERGVYVVLEWLVDLSTILADVRKDVNSLVAQGKRLTAMAEGMLLFALEHSMQYVAGDASRRGDGNRPEAGVVRHRDSQHGDPIVVDLVCRPSVAGFADQVAGRIAGDAQAEAGGIAPGETGRTGYCSQCHRPDATGMACPHIVCFVTQKVRPNPDEQAEMLTALFHRSFRVTAIKEALDSVGELAVPTINEVPVLGHQISPLVGKRGPGRPKAVGKKLGRKPNETKRIRSNGELERNEARKERGLETAAASGM